MSDANQPSKSPAPGFLPLLALVFGSALIVGLMVWSFTTGDTEQLSARLAQTPTDAVAKDAQLLNFALKQGKAVFTANCASCHGADRKGIAAQHTPDLTDAAWIFGGEDIETFKMHPSDIEITVLYGIHADHPKTRNLGEMPPFGEAGRVGLPQAEIEELKEEGRLVLTTAEIEDLVEYVLQISGRPSDEQRAARGSNLYNDKAGCFDCHAYDHKGDSAIGSADLTSPNTWIFGSDRDSIRQSITMGREGISPAFADKLSPADIKAVSLYVMPHS